MFRKGWMDCRILFGNAFSRLEMVISKYTRGKSLYRYRELVVIILGLVNEHQQS